MGIYGQDWAGYQSPAPSTDGLSFVFVKATEGLTYTNPNYAAQLAYARLHKLTVGHYHYPHMANSPAAEADRFLAVADIASGELPCLDWEGYDAANKKVPAATQVAYKNAFLARVRGKLPTHQVGTYANKAYLAYDPSGPYGDFFWIATAGLPAGKPGISRPWLFHQYGASGVDKDYCPLSAAALKEFTHAKEIDMPLTAADVKAVAKEVVAELTAPGARDSLAGANLYWLLRAVDPTIALPADGGPAATVAKIREALAKHGASAPIDYTALAKALLAEIKS
jgi:hypothetical protein